MVWSLDPNIPSYGPLSLRLLLGLSLQSCCWYVLVCRADGWRSRIARCYKVVLSCKVPLRCIFQKLSSDFSYMCFGSYGLIMFCLIKLPMNIVGPDLTQRQFPVLNLDRCGHHSHIFPSLKPTISRGMSSTTLTRITPCISWFKVSRVNNTLKFQGLIPDERHVHLVNRLMHDRPVRVGKRKLEWRGRFVSPAWAPTYSERHHDRAANWEC